MEKGGKTGIIYEILDNVDAEIRALVVNNREFAAEDAGNGEWKVTADAPETAGKCSGSPRHGPSRSKASDRAPTLQPRRALQARKIHAKSTATAGTGQEKPRSES